MFGDSKRMIGGAQAKRVHIESASSGCSQIVFVSKVAPCADHGVCRKEMRS